LADAADALSLAITHLCRGGAQQRLDAAVGASGARAHRQAQVDAQVRAQRAVQQQARRRALEQAAEVAAGRSSR
ncbi:MAG: crossover junction endodeoxyribonuclease RuvC, partial [Nocardioides kribbensis]